MRARGAVKICGLVRNADARVADEVGADYLGVVLSAGFGRSVAPERAASVLEGTSAARVAVLVDEAPARAATLARGIDAAVLQLHGSERPEEVVELRERGEWGLWKAVRAATADDVRRAVDRFGAIVDGLLVEGKRDGVVGGGGVRLALDPAAVRDAVPSALAFVLAGGLTPEGVEDAVARFRPDVVDVSSGVERAVGEKDPARVAAFVRSAKRAFDLHAHRPT
jgi:phosphoribosylanthranilate isomerase